MVSDIALGALLWIVFGPIAVLKISKYKGGFKFELDVDSEKRGLFLESLRLIAGGPIIWLVIFIK